MSFKKHNLKKDEFIKIKKLPKIVKITTGILAIGTVCTVCFFVLQEVFTTTNLAPIGSEKTKKIDEIAFSNGKTLGDENTLTQTKDGVFDKLFELGKQKSAREKIRKELEEKENKKDKINILILGRGGAGHDAPDLTDTIILASINKSSKIISLLSVPRDLYVDYGNNRKGKINQIYALEKNKSKSEEFGMIAIADKIKEITNEPIDYFVNIDFGGFKKLIDTLGGVEITIDKAFTDNEYPDGKWGYKTVVFRKGTWLFDGENALKYARSRHSTSDFDRSLRQQQIINAVKEKLNAGYLLTSPFKIKELYDVFNEYVYTNLKLQDILKIGIMVKSNDYITQSFNINNTCFYGTSSCEKGGFLYTPDRNMFGGASVLLPNNATYQKLSEYSQIKKYSNIIFNHPGFFQEKYKINIFNSLPTGSLATNLTNELLKYGFYIPKVKSIGNTGKVYANSVIYYNGIDENSETLKVIAEFFPNIKFEKNTGVKYAKELDTQIEIIIGEDYKNTLFNNI